jgi:glycosyltransferase involved in cell wall biosynthesis
MRILFSGTASGLLMQAAGSLCEHVREAGNPVETAVGVNSCEAFRAAVHDNRLPDVTESHPMSRITLSQFLIQQQRDGERISAELRFLVVESRGKWGNALGVLGFKPEDFPNVRVIGHQLDMRRVYASTRVVLLPSLWHESGARVIAESQINHIPVLASDTGGSAELIGEGGKVFALREEVREKRGEVLITDDELRPWIEELRRLWNDDTYYQSMQAKVAAHADRFDIRHSVDRYISAIAPHMEADRASAWLAKLRDA